jgi:hypothetical protein
MKKDYEERIQRFLLEQQLTDVKVKGSGSEKKNDTAIPITAVDHVTQVALETCRCSHLQEYFPHLLDLELCKANHHPRGWVVANPVHSLHVASQLEDASPASQHWKQPPILYGEEQQRTIALNTEGIVEYWCPLDGYSAVIHDDTALEKMEHLPTVHKQKPSLPSHAHSSSQPPSSPPKSPKNKQHPPKSSSTPDKPLSEPNPTPEKPLASSPGGVAPPALSIVPSIPSAMDSSVDPPKTASADLKTNPNTTDGPAPTTSSAVMKPPASPMKIDPHIVVSSLQTPTSATSPEKAVSSTADAAPTPNDPTASGHSPDAHQESELNHLRLEEDRIRLIRRSLSSHRLEQKRKADPKKKRKRVADLKSPGIPGWRPSDPKELSNEQEEEWKDALVAAREKVDCWMENYRICREAHWEERNSKTNLRDKPGSFYLPMDMAESTRCCAVCVKKRNKVDPCWEGKKASARPFQKLEGDSLMQCLECSFVGCSPQSIDPHSRQHILQHLLISGHKFGRFWHTRCSFLRLGI